MRAEVHDSLKHIYDSRRVVSDPEKQKANISESNFKCDF